ncbi:MAG: glycosyltransferase family 2 protein [Rhabdochlamydiaceae bacterium]|nr:glycosyltransferase family 2 protein [Rhabdochlamydiaceae bacterium]
MKATIVILNWNGKKDTLACLKSLSPYKDIIVVDNGSHDDSVHEIKKQFPWVQVIETGINLGYAGGNNVGIEAALRQGAEAVLLLNNDTVVDPEMMNSFIESAEKNPSVGIWGGYPLRFSDPEHLDHLGGVWQSEKGDFELIGLSAKKGFCTDKKLDYVCGCSIFIRREVFDKIGLLETKFFLFWEESDFAMRAKKAGFGIEVCYEAILFHKVSASFIGGSPHKKYFWWRGRLLWIERNCSPEEKKRLFSKLLNPELWHYKKLLWIKGAELRLLKLLRKQNTQEKEEKLKQYRAALQGLRDYKSNQFGSGPSWLYARKSLR